MKIVEDTGFHSRPVMGRHGRFSLRTVPVVIGSEEQNGKRKGKRKGTFIFLEGLKKMNVPFPPFPLMFLPFFLPEFLTGPRPRRNYYWDENRADDSGHGTQ